MLINIEQRDLKFSKYLKYDTRDMLRKERGEMNDFVRMR